MRGTTLDVMVAALREVGGYLVWRAANGEQFVTMSKREFDHVSQADGGRDVQLILAAGPAAKSALSAREPASSADEPASSAGELLERINREIALYRQSEEEEVLVEEDAREGEGERKVRFEPIRGDLSPELQE